MMTKSQKFGAALLFAGLALLLSAFGFSVRYTEEMYAEKEYGRPFRMPLSGLPAGASVLRGRRTYVRPACPYHDGGADELAERAALREYAFRPAPFMQGRRAFFYQAFFTRFSARQPCTQNGKYGILNTGLFCKRG